MNKLIYGSNLYLCVILLSFSQFMDLYCLWPQMPHPTIHQWVETVCFCIWMVFVHKWQWVRAQNLMWLALYFLKFLLTTSLFFSISCPCSLFLGLGLYLHFCIMHSQTEERMQGEVRIILWHCCQLVFILRFLLFSARKKNIHIHLW